MCQSSIQRSQRLPAVVLLSLLCLVSCSDTPRLHDYEVDQELRNEVLERCRGISGREWIQDHSCTLAAAAAETARKDHRSTVGAIEPFAQPRKQATPTVVDNVQEER